MSSDVDQLIVELWPGREVRVEPLHGGITNANFLVDLGDEQVVLRISGENTELLGIDRRHETAANHLASSIGIAPEVLANSENKGWMVTRFVAGRPIPPSELASEPMLGKFVKTLRRLHRAGSIGMEFNPFSVIRSYHEIAVTRDVVEPFDYPAASSVLDRISAVRAFAPTAFCHNDLLNGNLLYDGEIRILDWEYAGMGDPFFDLANFSVNHELPAASDEILLKHYFGNCGASLVAVLALMKMISELRETMWGVVQLAVSTLDVDFAAYCQERSERYRALLEAMDFEETLHRASQLTS
jgi:thiamine kinase-like enzyme